MMSCGEDNILTVMSTCCMPYYIYNIILPRTISCPSLTEHLQVQLIYPFVCLTFNRTKESERKGERQRQIETDHWQKGKRLGDKVKIEMNEMEIYSERAERIEGKRKRKRERLKGEQKRNGETNKMRKPC